MTNTGRHEVAGNTGGHGLIGIRERVLVAGGRVSAGPTGDGYAVDAELPYLVPATSPT